MSKQIKLTNEQELTMNALVDGAYISTSCGMWTAGGTYFKTLHSGTLSGLIRKGLLEMVVREDQDGDSVKVWVRKASLT